MREFIKPLKLATMATRKPSSEDVTVFAETSTPSSLYWTASDTSQPPTPTFSLRSHSRLPSSSSSLASSPISLVGEHPDVCGSSSKLPMPKLAEDPTEHDDAIPRKRDSFQDNLHSYDLDNNSTPHGYDRTTLMQGDSVLYDLNAGLFGDDFHIVPPKVLKRQASVGTLSSRLGERFPSFSNRWKHRKSGPLITSIPSTGSSRPPSSRSSSVTSSNFPNLEQKESATSTPLFRPNSDFSPSVSPVDITRAENHEPIDREALASTPLLPPMMNEFWPYSDRIYSPLQSPTIADTNKTFSTISSPGGTPPLRGFSSPALSTKPSVASFHRSRTGTLPASSDVPPLFIPDPSDEWSIKLGHGNFSIVPAPYVPEICDAESCRQLVADWELARRNYFRHKHRTIEHYGSNSKTFKLTEQKWTEIDVQWRRNNDLATAEAARNSTDAVPITPTEPATLTIMPTLDDPRSEGKFPKLGDQDIVGPMVQIEARAQPSPRQGSVAKLFSMFTRSRSATR